MLCFLEILRVYVCVLLLFFEDELASSLATLLEQFPCHQTRDPAIWKCTSINICDLRSHRFDTWWFGSATNQRSCSLHRRWVCGILWWIGDILCTCCWSAREQVDVNKTCRVLCKSWGVGRFRWNVKRSFSFSICRRRCLFVGVWRFASLWLIWKFVWLLNMLAVHFWKLHKARNNPSSMSRCFKKASE